MTTITKASPFARNHLIRDGINKAIYETMREDSSIHLFGEGAHIKVHYDYPDIERDFGDRVHTLPICEDGSNNFAVGASLLGVKPIVNVIGGDFLYRAMDSIVNTAAKLNATGGEHTVVIQAEFLLGGPTSGQRNEALFTHIPGLQVVMPSTPHDAYGLMQTVLREPGVTLFLEDRMVQDDGPWLEDDLELSGRVFVGDAQCKRPLDSPYLTILTYGVLHQVTRRAVSRFHLSCDVVDLRSLYPLDWPFILFMANKTRKVLIVEPDIVYGGIGAEIAATLHERIPGITVQRLGAPRLTAPASQALHHELLPTEEEVLAAIRNLC